MKRVEKLWKIGGWGQESKDFECKTWKSELFELILVKVGWKKYFSESKLQAGFKLEYKTLCWKTNKKVPEIVSVRDCGT